MLFLIETHKSMHLQSNGILFLLLFFPGEIIPGSYRTHSLGAMGASYLSLFHKSKSHSAESTVGIYHTQPGINTYIPCTLTLSASHEAAMNVITTVLIIPTKLQIKQTQKISM